jgi:hypothetical protein
LMKVIPVVFVSVPDKGFSSRLWAYLMKVFPVVFERDLMKVILVVFERTWWRLF